jgi:signal peptidase I
MSNQYSLSKSYKILKACYECYRKKWKSLSPQELEMVESDLAALDQACLAKNRAMADSLSRRMEHFLSRSCKKSIFDYFKELVIAIVVALIIATVVRQVWFEPYEIPTGSMRPTFMEQDHLVVSKTTFGINTPLMTDHLYFDPALVKRGGIFVFSGDGIDLEDTDSTYFGLFPYKKRYIKRCMGLPGDILYFYGGEIYGIDKEGHDISADFRNRWIKEIDHVPFISFEGRISINPTNGGANEVLFRQMDKPIARLPLNNTHDLKGEIFDGKEWISDQFLTQKTEHDAISTYTDFYGMRNFAMARLLTKEQVEKFSGVPTATLGEGILYLELRHNPSLTYPQPRLVQDNFGNYAIVFVPYVSVIPLQQHHLDTIMDNIYTARFVVQDGRARRYSVEQRHFGPGSPHFPGIPDGTYEFYAGKASKILWGGMTQELSKQDPLYNRDPASIQRLFNLGIDMSTYFEPHSQLQVYMPTRYSYFREGSLYLLGAELMKKDDPVLVKFNEQETQRELDSNKSTPYIAFNDYGPPLRDGKLDKEFIKAFGIQVPEKHYMALGDNYAMSSDSRYFGFVPEQNVQGAPSFLIWPKVGLPNQKPYPWITTPNLIVWSTVALIFALWGLIHWIRRQQPVYKKVS